MWSGTYIGESNSGVSNTWSSTTSVVGAFSTAASSLELITSLRWAAHGQQIVCPGITLYSVNFSTLFARSTEISLNLNLTGLLCLRQGSLHLFWFRGYRVNCCWKWCWQRVCTGKSNLNLRMSISPVFRLWKVDCSPCLSHRRSHLFPSIGLINYLKSFIIVYHLFNPYNLEAEQCKL